MGEFGWVVKLLKMKGEIVVTENPNGMWLGLKRERDAVNNRVEINAEVMQGKPVIRGTRIPVELLLRKLAEGAVTADLLDAYPRLTQEDVRAALEYAADTIAHETVLALSSD